MKGHSFSDATLILIHKVEDVTDSEAQEAKGGIRECRPHSFRYNGRRNISGSFDKFKGHLVLMEQPDESKCRARPTQWYN